MTIVKFLKLVSDSSNIKWKKVSDKTNFLNDSVYGVSEFFETSVGEQHLVLRHRSIGLIRWLELSVRGFNGVTYHEFEGLMKLDSNLSFVKKGHYNELFKILEKICYEPT